MTRWPTFSPAAETTTPLQTSGPAAPRPSPPGLTSPAPPWLHNHAYRQTSLSPSRLPSNCTCQVDGAVPAIAELELALEIGAPEVVWRGAGRKRRAGRP